jgi:hypothetical protein
MTQKNYYRKKGTVVWPSMFFGGFKLQLEKITTGKKRYSRLAVSWKLEKITCKKKRESHLVVGWSTKHKTQHTS